MTLDGSGSTAGTDPSAGAVATYAWDLDADGQYDDATGATPSFTRVGQDGVFPIGLEVTDAFGNTSTSTSQVTVTNVAPTVTVDGITPVDELGTVTVTGTVTDPGWLDPLTATISYDDGAAPVALSGALENARPNATLSFSVTHQYGDNGAFTVQVCAADDDTTGNCGDAVANVANVDPTAVIDTAGEQVYDGVSAFVVEAGEPLTVPVGSHDPGSDDLRFAWAWGDGTVDEQTSLVNPPATDPAKSPSVQPRDVTRSQTHAYADACAYTLDTTVTDDDLGSASDSALVLITGNGTTSRGHGWWLNQYRVKKSNDFTPARAAVLPRHRRRTQPGVRRAQGRLDASRGDPGAQQPGEVAGGRHLRPAGAGGVAQLRQRLGQAVHAGRQRRQRQSRQHLRGDDAAR